MDPTIAFTVNGKPVSVTTDPDRPLLEVLREDLQLTGSHFGCGESECGACSVLIGKGRAFSCSTAISEIEGRNVTTIEGLASGERLHAVQQAFLDEGAYQCGYCTPGMIIATVALLNGNPTPTDDEIREALDGNLCRCCGYARIFTAVRRAATTVAATTANGGNR